MHSSLGGWGEGGAERPRSPTSAKILPINQGFQLVGGG